MRAEKPLNVIPHETGNDIQEIIFSSDLTLDERTNDKTACGIREIKEIVDLRFNILFEIQQDRHHKTLSEN